MKIILCPPTAYRLLPTAYKVLIVAVIAATAHVQSQVKANEPPRVEFELVTDQGLTPSTTQKWYKTLTDLKVAGLRIRGAAPGDQPKIEQAGTSDRPLYRVLGRINARGMLVLPGGQFTTADGPKIARWIRDLTNDGAQGVTERRSAFGLTRQQFEEVTTDLMRPVGFSTKGMAPTDAARKILASLKLKATVDDEVKRALAADDPVRDELQGLSSGTVLAAILRPAGAALVPVKPEGASVQLRLAAAEGVTDLWPVGWPSEKQPAKVAPKLFEFLNAEIEGVSAAEAIEAIRGRLDTAFLFDHNNMIRHRIDLTKLVAIPARRTYYSKVLQQVLFNAGLKYELRVDENEKPFFWITTLKR